MRAFVWVIRPDKATSPSGIRTVLPDGATLIRPTAMRNLVFRLELQNFFHERNGQFALRGDGGVIKLIERHKQRAHFSVEPFEQEAPHVFREFKSAQSGA